MISKMRAASAYPASVGSQKYAQFIVWWLRWLLALCLGLGGSAAAWAANAWEQTSGPEGGWINQLAVAPNLPTTLYVGTEGGGGSKAPMPVRPGRLPATG